MAVRGRVRRERREQAVPVHDDVPSPEQLFARAQIQQQVNRLVLELPEPLRATLLLRFFEGLSAAEIARAQNIPAATVRSRLKDALDRIRATLDGEHRGQRRTWVALLAPFVPQSSTTIVAGGLLVKKLLIALVAAVLLVVVVQVVRHSKSSSTTPASRAAPSAVATTQVAPVPAAAAATAHTVPAIHDDDPKGTLRLEGQVVDDHDAPVGGATVAIDANPPIVVTTEADGAFVFDGLIRRDYRVEATKGELYGGPVRLRLGDKTEPVTVRVALGGTIEVTVTDAANGSPIAGADVELRSTLTWKARSGGNGVATLTGIGATWAPLVARAEGFAPAALRLQASGQPATVQTISLALSHGAALVGRVVDDKGKPVAGARVVATSASEPLPVVDPRRDGVLAGADGSFTIPVVAAGTWRLTATHGDAAPTTSVPITVDGTHARTGIELVLTSGAIVRGTVKDKTGAPVAGADVSVVGNGFVEWRARRQAFTDAGGHFTIAGLERRAVEVVAWHESGSSAIVAADLAAQREQDVTLTLELTGAIHGTVVDRAGQPIADAQVVADPDFSGGVADRAVWSVRGVQETVADQGGAFTFAGRPDGTYRIRAARPGASEAALALSEGITAKPGDTVKLAVPADGRLAGKVELAGGKPPAAFTLTLGGTNAVPFASPDGAFVLTGAAGTYPLTVEGPGFVSLTKEVTLSEGKDTDAGTITVQPGRSISGRVVDEHGVPVAKATVAAGFLLTGGGAELYIKDESPGAQDTTTDDNGQFVLSGFPPAAITIVAGKPNVGRSASVQLPASPDSATLDLALAPTTSLAGTIVQNGKPLPDTVVIANPIGAVASNFFVTTGPDGTFTLDALAPGAYIVYPMLGGGGNRPKDIYTRRVDLAPGAKAQVTIDATPGTLTLAVTVKTDNGQPLPGAQLITCAASIDPHTVAELRDGTNNPFGDTVMPVYMRGVQDGAAEVTGMKPGPHTLCVVAGDPRDPSSAKMTCAHHTMTAAAKQSATVIVPAAWLDEK
jgi:uncharacterized GH25 family protein